MKLDLSDNTIREVVHKAILDTISSEQRDALIKAAITHLLAPVKDYNGRPSSPLQEAYNRAVESYANEVIRAQLKEDSAFKLAVDDTIKLALERFNAQNRDAVAEKVATAIAAAMKMERY